MNKEFTEAERMTIIITALLSVGETEFSSFMQHTSKALRVRLIGRSAQHKGTAELEFRIPWDAALKLKKKAEELNDKARRGMEKQFKLALGDVFSEYPMITFSTVTNEGPELSI
jgi:hypothetical protein